MKFNIQFTPAEMNLVGVALGKLPFEAVARLMASVQAQITEQEQAAAAQETPKQAE